MPLPPSYVYRNKIKNAPTDRLTDGKSTDFRRGFDATTQPQHLMEAWGTLETHKEYVRTVDKKCYTTNAAPEFSLVNSICTTFSTLQ